MDNGFQQANLGDILTRSEEWIDIWPDKQYRQVTVRLWGKGVIQRDEVSGAEIAADRRFVIRSQQFILSRIDARNGAFGIVPDSLNGAVVSSDFPVFVLDQSQILPQFLDWMSKTRDFVNLCKAASEGTTNRVRLQEERFLAAKISLPSLEEQHRIVARIEELAARIEEARGLRRDAVVEAEKIESLATRAILMNLDNATAKPLRQLVTLRGGGTPSKSIPSFWEGKIPWISPKDMKIREINDAIDHISEEATQESSAKLIEPGAVLIVVRGMILAHTVPSAVLRVPASINQDMKALVTNEILLPQYLCIVLWGLNHKLLELVEKSTHDTRKLETSKLLDFTIPMPSLTEQHRVVAYLGKLRSKIDFLKQLQSETSAELDALLPSILDKAFKGEL